MMPQPPQYMQFQPQQQQPAAAAAAAAAAAISDSDSSGDEERRKEDRRPISRAYKSLGGKTGIARSWRIEFVEVL
jgi:hypothetical protein